MPKKKKSSKATRQTCVLVVDANVLIRDFWWEGPGPQFLINRLFLYHKLVVPELALREAAKALERRADELLNRMGQEAPSARHLAQYQRLFGKTAKDEEDAHMLSLRYEHFVRDLVDKHDGLVAPIPEIALTEIVERSVNRIKPFNKGDKGFRDTLLWFGVLDLVKQFKRVSFVSENTNDFADDERALHSDLEREVGAVLPEHIRFRYFATLDEFIALMDKDGIASAEAFRRAVMSGDFRGFTLHQWLEDNLTELVNDFELDGVRWAGMPYWAEDPRLLEIDEIVGIEACNERLIAASQVEIFCDVAIVGEFQCSILYSSWESVVHATQVEWVDEESDDMWTEIGIRAVGTFTIRLVFDLDKVSVMSADLVPLEHDFAAARDTLRSVLEERAKDNEE